MTKHPGNMAAASLGCGPADLSQNYVGLG